MSAAPWRAKRRRRRSASLMLRVPSSDRVVEVRELAPVPDLHRAAVAALAADADALRVVAGVAEGRRAAGADPPVAALVAALLLLEAPAQRLHQRVPAAERLDPRLFLIGEGEREVLFQPVRRQFGGEQGLERGLGAAEVRGEHAVEAVVVALVLDQDGAGEVVETFGRGEATRGDCPLVRKTGQGDSSLGKRVQQRQEFRHAHRHAGRAKHQEEADQHGAARRERQPGRPARRLRNTSCSNRCTSCSFLSSAP